MYLHRRPVREAMFCLDRGRAILVMNEEHDASFTITSVKLDKKERRRYHIFCEAEEPVLFVHEDILIRFRLMKGQQLTTLEVENIRKEDEQYRAYALAIYYLGAKPRTRKQLEQYLTRKEFEENNIIYALDRLESEHIIDDDAYAVQFAAQRLRNGLKGRRWIKQELQQRGISRDTAAEVVNALDQESELASAKVAAEKKWRSLKGEQKDRKRKLMGYLLRRGYPGDIVKEAVNSIDINEEIEMFDEDDGLLLDN